MLSEPDRSLKLLFLLQELSKLHTHTQMLEAYHIYFPQFCGMHAILEVTHSFLRL